MTSSRFAFATATLVTERWSHGASVPGRGHRLSHRHTQFAPMRRARPYVHTAAAPPPPSASSTENVQDEKLKVPSQTGEDIPVILRVESLSPRRLQVSGAVRVDSSLKRVWRVLTAFPLHQEFIPNLISTTPVRRDGQLLLDQVGLISRKLRLRSRLLLRVDEDFDKRRISLMRVEGRDFAEFEAHYTVREGVPAGEVIDGTGDVVIEYECVASPFALYPMSLVERKIVKEVPRMLVAVRDEAMKPTHVPCYEAKGTNGA